MKNIAFGLTSALLAAATATAEAVAGETSAAAPAAKTTKKQHTLVAFEKDKDFVNDLQKEFWGPQASNPDEKRFLSSQEAIHILLTVATDYRWEVRQKTEIIDDEEVPVFAEDGTPEMERIDRFGVVAERLIEARGVKRLTSKEAAMAAQLEELKAQLAALQGAQTAAPVAG